MRRIGLVVIVLAIVGAAFWLLRRADGSVVAEQKGLTRGSGGALSFLPLPPGAYVLHWEIPGEAPRDVPLTLEAGTRLDLGLPR